LVELKWAAARELPVQSVRSLLGLGHFGRRVWFYHYLRAALPVDVRRFWDGEERAIREGLVGAGRVEREMARIRARVLPLTGASRPGSEPGVRWRLAARAWAPRVAAAADAEGSDAPERAAQAWAAGWPSASFLATGQWPDLEAAHPWISTPGHAAVKANRDALTTMLAAPDVALAAASPGAYSVVVLGRAPPGASALAALPRVLRPGGRVLGWGAVPEGLSCDPAKCDAIGRLDRGLFPGRPWLARAR
jgi:hypothetical protein